MKRLIVRLLAAIGLVPARRYHEVARRVGAISRDRDDWKKRATKLARRGRTLEQQARDLERQLKKQLRTQGRPLTDLSLEGRAPTETSTAAEERGAAAPQHGELLAMQARLAETERALAIAREHLNAIEVMLEILEGAANVLDARTRTSPEHEFGKTGAAVR